MNGYRQALRISSPGRICLFGEHQDYLLLPVVSLAISLRIAVEGKKRKDRYIHVALPDIGSEVGFSLDEPLEYRQERDYIRSSVAVLRRAGFTFSSGFDCVVQGEIPVRAGTSSSSALVVAWVNFLTRMSDEGRVLPPEECARLAHAAEVLEFNEPGGMMDQYTAAFGGLLSLTFHPELRVESIAAPLKSFVLGDSREPKDTMAILARVKDRVLGIARRLAERHRGFSLHTIAPDDIDRFARDLSSDERSLLSGTVRNREITEKALALLRGPRFDDRALGALLNEHQQVLRDVLRISTPKIDRMLEAASRAGAAGGKINGSGGGGCMFAYAPEGAEAVAQAIEEAGGRTYVVSADTGTRAEPLTAMRDPM